MPPEDNQDGDQQAGSQQGSDDGQGNEDQTGSEKLPTWDDYLKDQPQEVQVLFKEHVQGLKHALDDERGENKKLASQLREAAKNTSDDTTKAALEGMAKAQDELTKKTEFYEAASADGCNNLRLAWIAANDIEAFDRKGNVDLYALKNRFPELFGTQKPAVPPRTNAGGGTQTKPGEFNMDDFIRTQSGRSTS